MRRHGTIAFLFLLFFSLHFKAQKIEKLYQYVNPFIGTEKIGPFTGSYRTEHAAAYPRKADQ